MLQNILGCPGDRSQSFLSQIHIILAPRLQGSALADVTKELALLEVAPVLQQVNVHILGRPGALARLGGGGGGGGAAGGGAAGCGRWGAPRI